MRSVGPASHSVDTGHGGVTVSRSRGVRITSEQQGSDSCEQAHLYDYSITASRLE